MLTTGLTAQLQTNFLFKSQTQTDVRKSSRKQGLETFCSEINEFSRTSTKLYIHQFNIVITNPLEM